MRIGAATGDPRLHPLAALTLAVVVALALGALTAYGQQWLPQPLGPLANSASPWALVAFLLAFLAPSRGAAVLAGFAALVGLLAGYVGADQLRGYPSSFGLLLFWGTAAVVAGPLLGLAAHWLRRSTGWRPAVGAGVMAGIVAGEGAYGLLYIAGTTSPAYWWGQLVAGVVLLAAASAWRLRRPPALALGAGSTVSTAVVFVLLYSRGGTVLDLL